MASSTTVAALLLLLGAPTAAEEKAKVDAVAEPDKPVSFGAKITWLAVKSDDPQAVIKALGLMKARKSNWKTGMEAAYRAVNTRVENGEAFVTPPIKGWVLVIGFGLPAIFGPPIGDEVSPLLERLGKTFPEVQWFSTHRNIDYCGWAKLKDGKIVRRYANLPGEGDVLANDGPPTEGEKKLKALFAKDGSTDQIGVNKLAGEWSVCPALLEEMRLGKSVGFVGTLPRK